MGFDISLGKLMNSEYQGGHIGSCYTQVIEYNVCGEIKEIVTISPFINTRYTSVVCTSKLCTGH